MLLCDWVKFWIETYKQPLLKPSTYDSYLSYAKNITCRKELGDLQPHDLQLIINGLCRRGAMTSTIKHVLTLLRQSLSKAHKLGYILDNNLCSEIELPPMRSTSVALLTENEINLVLENLHLSFYGDLFEFVALTGVRIGEAIALEWKDVDFFNKTININSTDYKGVRQSVKTRNGVRSLSMYPQLEKLLLRRFKDDFSNCERVFTNTKGEKCCYFSVRDAWRRYLKKIHIDGGQGLHSLRHAFASVAMRSGVSPKVISAWLGHSDVTVTLRIYSHVTAEDLRSFGDVMGGVFDRKPPENEPKTADFGG